jgi:hypothetical protein
MKKIIFSIVALFFLLRAFSQIPNLIKMDTSFFVSLTNESYGSSIDVNCVNNGITTKNSTIKNFTKLFDGNIVQFSKQDLIYFNCNPTQIKTSELILDFKKVINLYSFNFKKGYFYDSQFDVYTSSSLNGPWVKLSVSILNTSQLLTINLISKASRYIKLSITPKQSDNYSSAAIELFSYEVPLINASSTIIINNKCVTLTAAASGETYLWSTGETTQSIQVCDAGTYTCQVINTSFTGNQDHVASISIDKIETQDNLPAPNGEVYSIVKNGNTVYYGGDFNALGPITGSGSGIDNTSGLPNTSLPRINGTINTTISDNNGGWYVGGAFTKVGNYAISNLAHLNSDNSVDTTFKPQPNGAVNTLLLNGSSFYIGGAFTSIQGITNNYVAKIDRSNGSAVLWNAQCNGIVRSLTLAADQLVVGGDFTAIGGQTRNYLATVDTVYVQASAWNPNPNNKVYKVYSTASKLYVGGDFTNISAVAKGNGAGYSLPAFTLDGYNIGANGRIHDFIVNNNILYAAGLFTTIGGANRNYLAGLSPLNTIANSFNASADGIVRTLAISGGNLIVGGDFATIGGQSRNRIAALDLATGLATTWNPTIIGEKLINPTVNTIATFGNTIYAGGTFYSVGAETRNNAAAIDAATGQILPWNPNTNGIVRAIAADNNNVYLGGDFTTVNGSVTKNRIAQVNATSAVATGWNPNADNSINALSLQGNLLYVGGNFGNIGGAARAKFTVLSTTSGSASAFNPTANGNVNALAISGDTLYLGGDFTTIGGQTRNRLASYKISNSTLLAFNPNVNATVSALAVNKSKLYVGGAFSLIGSTLRYNFAEIDVTTGNATSLNTNVINGSSVNALAIQDSSVYSGGWYQYYNSGQPISNLATVKTQSGLLGYWQPQPDDIIRTMFIGTGKIYVGGRFKQINSRYQPFFASLDIYNSGNPPTITSVSTTSGCIGSTLTVNGSGFVNVTDVQIGSTSVPFVVNSTTSITLTPSTAMSGKVRVINVIGSPLSAENVTINALPTATITAEGSTSICQGSSVTLTSSIGSSYLWSTGATTASVSISTAGNYTVEVTDANGCKNTSTATTVSVNSLPIATITPIGPTTFCQGGITKLTCSIGSSYVWSSNYSWSSGSTLSNNISVMKAGSFTVEVTDENGCKNISSPIVITVNPLPTVTITPRGDTTICEGSSVTFTASNGSSYFWYTGERTSSISTTKAGYYKVDVTDANGCKGSSLSTVVKVNPAPIATITAGSSTAFCPGGTVTLSSSSGSSYLWSNGATTASISTTTAGSYTVEVTGANGCKKTSTATVVTVNSLPTATITPNGSTTICQGSSVTLTSSFGSSYLWSTGATTASISPTTAGNYTVQVTDANGCKNTSSSTIVSVNALPVATISAGGATTFCQGESVTLTSSTGSSYLWSTGATTASISPTTAGNYTVQVTDANGCKKTSSATIVTVNSLPQSIITTNRSTQFCQGENISINLTSSTGSSYLWSNGATTSSISPTTAGNYTVQVTDANGCKNTSSSTVVSLNTLPTATITAGGSTTFCQGESVTLTSSTGSSYLWSTGATTSTISPTTAGNYTVQVTDVNGCKNTSAATVVSVNTLPTATIASGGATTFCQGGSVTLTSSTGSSYLWSTGVTTSSISPTTAGNYTVQVTGANGCKNTSESIVVSVNTLPSSTITAGGATTFCQGGSVTLTSSTGSSYLWSTGATTVSISPTTSGSYTVQVTDANGCKNTSTATIVSVNTLPTATITADGATTFCQEGSVTLTSSTGNSYLWSTGATTSSISPTTAGNYTVQVTDANGCKNTSTATVVSVNTLPSATITAGGATTFCQGESVTLTSSTGSSYLWSTGATTSSISPTTVGNYTVQVTDANGCKNTSAATVISINTLPTVTITAGGATTFCQGASVTLTSSTGSSYLWSTGAITTSISPTAAGNYTVQVTDANGCKNTSDATVVTVNTLPTATITAGGATTFCQGGSVTLTSSTGSSYLWSTGATTSSISPTTAGNYTVQVTDANGCKNTSSSTVVSVNTLPIATITAGGATTFCQGGSVTLTSSTGSSYLWSTGATTASISPTTAGNYTVQVTDVNGCKNTSSATVVSLNILPTVTITAGGATTFCQGGSVTLTSSTGSSYLWSTGATTASISPTIAGNYTVQVTDANGCKNTSAATVVSVNTLPTATITAGGATTFCQDGSVTLTSSTGSSYLWSTGATTSSISPTTAGNYTVQVTDANGCKNTSAATVVTINTLPTVTITAGGATTFCQGGSVTLTSSTGSSYLWSTGATTASISPTTAGNYTVQLTDVNGCKNTSAVTIVATNPLPKVVALATKTSICSGENVSLTGSGASTYVWDNNVINGAVIIPTTTTSYEVTGTDMNGCIGKSSVTINVNQLPNVQISSNISTNKACEDEGLELSSNLNGVYAWSSGESTQTIFPSKSGIYSLKLTDVNGCSSISNAVKVTIYPLPNVVITVNGPVTYCTNNLSELVSSTGVSYLWNDGSVTKSIKPTTSGDYSVKVTDVNGCSNTSASTTLFVNNCAGIEDITQMNVSIYPNPTSDKFMVSLPQNNGVIEIKLFDNTGKLVKVITTIEKETTIPVVDLAEGIYTIKLYGDNLFYVTRVTISK